MLYEIALSLPHTVPAQRHVQVTSPTPEEREEEEVKEQPATPTSALPLPEELLSSHALRFITRRDLYTFLSKAGVSSLYCPFSECFMKLRLYKHFLTRIHCLLAIDHLSLLYPCFR